MSSLVSKAVECLRTTIGQAVRKIRLFMGEQRLIHMVTFYNMSFPVVLHMKFGLVIPRNVSNFYHCYFRAYTHHPQGLLILLFK